MENRTSKPHSSKRPYSANEILKASFKQQPPILTRGILPAGGGLILAGDSGVGKSLMRVEWSVLLAAGLEVYDMGTPRSQRVLIVQAENTIQQEQFRLDRVRQGLEMEHLPETLYYAPPVWPSNIKQKRYMQYVLDSIQMVNADVVFFDPLISYHGENENDNVKMRSVLNAFTHLSKESGAAIILIHHFGKPSEAYQSNDYRLRGAQAIRDWADTAVTIMPVKSLDDSRYAFRRLEFIKLRNGPYHPPLMLRRNQSFIHEITEDPRRSPSELLLLVVGRFGHEATSEQYLIKKMQEIAGKKYNKATLKNTVKDALASGLIFSGIVNGCKYYKVGHQES